MTQMFEKDPQTKLRTPWYSGLRNSFLTGIVVIAPVGLTVWLIWTVIGWVDGFVLPFVPDSYQPEALIKRVLGPETEVNIRGLGVIFFLFFTSTPTAISQRKSDPVPDHVDPATAQASYREVHPDATEFQDDEVPENSTVVVDSCSFS